MNQNLDEQKIRQLFRDAQHTDQQAAPPFAATLAAAMRRGERRKPQWMGLRIAVAAVSVAVISVSAFVSFRQAATPPKLDPIAQGRYVLPLPLLSDPVSPVVPMTVPDVPPILPTGSKPPRHHPRVTPPRQAFAQSAWLISAWQSPTDFLLTLPGQQLLKTVPRLHESLIEFNTILPDEKN